MTAGVAANGPPWNMIAGAAANATAKAATGIARTSFLRFTIFLLDVGYLSRSSRHLGRHHPPGGVKGSQRGHAWPVATLGTL
jgi:hypothetical protein